MLYLLYSPYLLYLCEAFEATYHERRERNWRHLFQRATKRTAYSGEGRSAVRAKRGRERPFRHAVGQGEGK